MDSKPLPGSRVLIPDDGGPVATVQPYRKDALLIPVLDDFGMPHDYPPSALKLIWSPGMV